MKLTPLESLGGGWVGMRYTTIASVLRDLPTELDYVKSFLPRFLDFESFEWHENGRLIGRRWPGDLSRNYLTGFQINRRYLSALARGDDKSFPVAGSLAKRYGFNSLSQLNTYEYCIVLAGGLLADAFAEFKKVYRQRNKRSYVKVPTAELMYLIWNQGAAGAVTSIRNRSLKASGQSQLVKSVFASGSAVWEKIG